MYSGSNQDKQLTPTRTVLPPHRLFGEKKVYLRKVSIFLLVDESTVVPQTPVSAGISYLGNFNSRKETS